MAESESSCNFSLIPRYLVLILSIRCSCSWDLGLFQICLLRTWGKLIFSIPDGSVQKAVAYVGQSKEWGKFRVLFVCHGFLTGSIGYPCVHWGPDLPYLSNRPHTRLHTFGRFLFAGFFSKPKLSHFKSIFCQVGLLDDVAVVLGLVRTFFSNFVTKDQTEWTWTLFRLFHTWDSYVRNTFMNIWQFG